MEEETKTISEDTTVNFSLTTDVQDSQIIQTVILSLDEPTEIIEFN